MQTKKIAAALAAVNAYLDEEREAAAAQALPPAQNAISAEPAAWALSARIEAMTSRRMMQFRAFSGLR